MRSIRNLLIAIGLVAAVGIAVNVFAHGGMMRWGDGNWGHRGPGMHHEGEYGPGVGGHWLNKDEYRQMEKQRETFLNETETVRKKLDEKWRELRSELAKSEPDTARASELQKEISDLESRFDQKHLEHMIEMRKINPDGGSGYDHMYGGGMMGHNSPGYGYCWR